MALGTWLVVAGISLALLGGLLPFAPGAPSWFGRLPGDLDLRIGGTRVVVPLTSLLLVSLVPSVVVTLLTRSRPQRVRRPRRAHRACASRRGSMRSLRDASRAHHEATPPHTVARGAPMAPRGTGRHDQRGTPGG